MNASIDLSSCKMFCESIASLREESLLRSRQTIKPYLWCGPEGLLVAHGRAFTPSAPPKGYRMGPMGQCYANAGRLASSMDDLFYCEGYALKDGIPMPLAHGWCCDKDGRVFDPTWRLVSEYFGVAFKREYFRTRMFETKTWGILFEDWQHDWQTLRTPAKIWKQEVG